MSGKQKIRQPKTANKADKKHATADDAAELVIVNEAANLPQPQDGRFNWITDAAGLANFIGVTVMTISNYNKMGMPKLERGKYNLKACWRWWLENVHMPKDASKKANTDHERYMAAKADNEEIKRDKLREILVLKAQIFRELGERVADLRTTFRAYKYRLGPMLEGKTCEEIMQVLGAENDRMLRSFCRAGRYIDTEIEPEKETETKPKKAPARKAKKKPAKKGKK